MEGIHILEQWQYNKIFHGYRFFSQLNRDCNVESYCINVIVKWRLWKWNKIDFNFIHDITSPIIASVNLPELTYAFSFYKNITNKTRTKSLPTLTNIEWGATAGHYLFKW